MISSLVVNIGYSGDLNTFTTVLLIHILKRILVKVDWSWPKTLRRFLLISSYLIWKSLETLTYLLGRQQFVYSTAVVGRS